MLTHRDLRMRLLAGIAVGICLLVHDQSSADCADHDDKLIETTRASVAIFANIRKTKNSIAVVAEKVLERAFEQHEASTDGCSGECGHSHELVTFRVAPVQFLPAAQQKAVCLDLEKQTQQTPIVFDDKKFRSLDDVNQWIMNFTRGKGSDGKRLYSFCTSNCSPRYTFLIAATEPGYRLDANVVCGKARDKSSAQYQLETRVRPRCDSGSTTMDIKAEVQ